VEIDLTGTYKITNNLSYMLGAQVYLFTGDYFKGIKSVSVNVWQRQSSKMTLSSSTNLLFLSKSKQVTASG